MTQAVSEAMCNCCDLCAAPAIRQSIKDQFDVPPEVFRYLGYGLFAEKKPERNREVF